MNSPHEEGLNRAESIVEALLDARDRGDTVSVDEACTGLDLRLRAQVEEMLGAYDRVSAILEGVGPPTVVVSKRQMDVPTPPGFVLHNQLGQGGMGVVFGARETSLDRPVAIKFLLPELAQTNSSARARFLREARALAAVKHQNVVSIYQVGEVAGVPYLVMPLLDGQTLEDYLREVPRPPLPEVLRIGREIAAGLAAAHARGIVHRDVKPGNVWLEGTGRQVKILDFGLARKSADALTATFANEANGPTADVSRTAPGLVSGTPPYMSPEQMRGEALDARSDLFSLGTILYQLATGRLPFPSSDLASLYKQVVHDQPPPARALHPEIPGGLAQLIAALHAKDPEARPRSAGEVERRLCALEMPRRPILRWLSLVAGILVLVGGVWAVTSWLWPAGVTERKLTGPLVVDLDVRVWKDGRREERGKRLWESGVLPLRPNDAVRLEARVDRPAYLYLVWLQADGGILPGHPWQNDDWAQRPAREEAMRELNVHAAANEGIPLDGQVSGVEAFVLLARETPLPAHIDLRELLAGWHRQTEPGRDLDLAAWVVNGQLDVAGERGRSFSGKVHVTNPVGVVRDLTQTLYTGHGLASRVVCFGYRGK